MSVDVAASRGSWASLISSATAAVIVGYVSTILVVMKGSEAVGATVAQQASTAAMTCFGMAVTTLILGWHYRMPLIVAWSTPGSALLASSAGALGGIAYSDALGAFMFAGALMMLTALVRPIAWAIERTPPAIASAMLAGVLFKFVLAVPAAAVSSPWLVLPIIAVYFTLRLLNSFYAVPVAVIVGITLALTTTRSFAEFPVSLAPLIFEMPTINVQALVSIGIPLFFVTMASQNLPGFAVIRASGYQPPVAGCLAVTGFGSMICAPFGAHAINMAAITASLVTGPETHPDPGQRWKVIFPYFVLYALFGVAALTFVSTLGALPKDIVAAIAGLALFGPIVGSIAAMVQEKSETDAAIVTFAVTASGITLFSIGAAFWGLIAGLVYWGLKRLSFQRTSK
jgi:benzoate membrane transport protein